MNHVHVKDVSAELADAVRGEETGIACSQVPLGGGVNAENIRKCVEYLRETDFDGVLSIECYGTEQEYCQQRPLCPGIAELLTACFSTGC